MPNVKKSTQELLKEDDTPGDNVKKGGAKIQPKHISKAIKNDLQTAPIKDLKWLEAYIRTGEATKQAKKIYKLKNDYQATHKALDLKKKYQPVLKEMIINYIGATEPYFFRELIKMTKADTYYMTKDGIQQMPDNKTRLNALKELGEILDIKENKGVQGQQNNILIVQNKEEGVFSIQSNNNQES